VIDRRLLGGHGRQRLLDGSFTCSLWNNVPGDWRDPTGWVDVCVATAAEQEWSVIAVHDVATGAMGQLQRLVDRLDARAVVWRQDLPDECTPIRRGRPTSSFELIEV
jgi:hypothetical protein